MRNQNFMLQLDPGLLGPVYVRIAMALAASIQSGLLKPGTALPGIRVVAEQLKVNRNTVAAAFQELEAEGWVETRFGSGTYVSPKPPELLPKGWSMPTAPASREQETAFDIASHLMPLTDPLEGQFDLRDGHPDPRLLPADEIAGAYHRALKSHGCELMNYGEPYGQRSLREALSQWLAERRGIMAGADRILITSGARMGLDLLARGLLSPGDAVAVEEPGTRLHLETLAATGARLVSIPVDEEGMRVELLEQCVVQEGVRMVYVTPQHQARTGACLSADRRRRLLALAHAHRFPIIEDDYEYEWHFDGRPLFPIASQDARGSVITLGSFSRWLAPGLRLGFLVGRTSVIERLARLRVRMDAQGDRVLEKAMATILLDGTFASFVRRARKAYQDRRDTAVAGVAAWAGFTCAPCAGGLGLWLRVPSGFDLQGWLRDAGFKGVLMEGHGDGQHLRLGFGNHTPEELREAFKLITPR